jgi:hypothetical protein
LAGSEGGEEENRHKEVEEDRGEEGKGEGEGEVEEGKVVPPPLTPMHVPPLLKPPHLPPMHVPPLLKPPHLPPMHVPPLLELEPPHMPGEDEEGEGEGGGEATCCHQTPRCNGTSRRPRGRRSSPPLPLKPLNVPPPMWPPHQIPLNVPPPVGPPHLLLLPLLRQRTRT